MKELYSLQDLFYQRLFRIPDYQRGYSLTEQQLDEFWNKSIRRSSRKIEANRNLNK